MARSAPARFHKPLPVRQALREPRRRDHGGKGKGLDILASGSLTVRDLRLKDARTEKVYALLRRLSADTFRFSSASSSFEAKAVLLDLLRMDVALNADKTLDILECVPKKQTGQEPSSPFRFPWRP